MLKNLFSNRRDTLGLMLHCPVCQFEYTHISGASIIEGNDNYEAWAGRGGAVLISMWCENGHSWDVRFGFHKGSVFMDVENEKEIDLVRNELNNLR